MPTNGDVDPYGESVTTGSANPLESPFSGGTTTETPGSTPLDSLLGNRTGTSDPLQSLLTGSSPGSADPLESLVTGGEQALTQLGQQAHDALAGLGQLLHGIPGFDQLLASNPQLSDLLSGIPGLDQLVPGGTGLEGLSAGNPELSKLLSSIPGLDELLTGSSDDPTQGLADRLRQLGETPGLEGLSDIADHLDPGSGGADSSGGGGAADFGGAASNLAGADDTTTPQQLEQPRQPDRFPRASLAADLASYGPGAQDPNDQQAGQPGQPGQPGMAGTPASSAANGGGQGQHRRPKYLTSTDWLDDAMGETPFRVKPVIEP